MSNKYPDSPVQFFHRDFPWQSESAGPVRLWYRGYERNNGFARLAGALAALPHGFDLRHVASLLKGCSGHFAILVEGLGWRLGAVDRSRTTPLFFYSGDEVSAIGAHAPALAKRFSLGIADIDPQAAIPLAMSGYTIGDRTLYRNLRVLRPAECVLIRDASRPERAFYDIYAPWRVEERSTERWSNELTETLLSILDRLLQRAAGRTIAIPLSAGLDSRAIASGLKHLGAKDVRLFTYGHRDGFEARTAQAIAEALNYKWRLVPLDFDAKRTYFASEEHADYISAQDTLCAVPFEQDLDVILTLKQKGWLPEDSIVVNGNSGDFLSGGHIVPALRRPLLDADDEKRLATIVDCLVAKHFALWSSLLTPERVALVKQLLTTEILEAMPSRSSAYDHGLYEYSEFMNRQAKYVINGQRVYDHVGLDWELPLWDDDCLHFWAGVPLSLKANQGLYSKTLIENNWGGVWSHLAVNKKSVSPRWISVPRLVVRAACAPLGRAIWHRIERNALGYWMDLLGGYAATPYWRLLVDRRGHRNPISWFAEKYLARAGLQYDGVPIR